MNRMLDVFRLETGGVRWLESAATLEGAKARVKELALHSPGEYLVVDQKTGDRHVITLDVDEGRSTVVSSRPGDEPSATRKSKGRKCL
jgi:hypothetical protein